jgi:hypothetical protein
MTAERTALLTALDFAWGEGHRAMEWATQVAKLEAYKTEHGDCDVPTGWVEDLALGNWVHRQRSNTLKLDAGEPTPGITAARVVELTGLDFNAGEPAPGMRVARVVELVALGFVWTR